MIKSFKVLGKRRSILEEALIRSRLKNELLMVIESDSAYTVDHQSIQQARKQWCDTVKRFVDYAAIQGSRNASKYFTNITFLEYDALFIFKHRRRLRLRNRLNPVQLALLSSADQIVIKALEDGMSVSLHYKDIYRLAKRRVVEFAQSVGRSPVGIGLLEQQDEESSLNDCKKIPPVREAVSANTHSV